MQLHVLAQFPMIVSIPLSLVTITSSSKHETANDNLPVSLPTELPASFVIFCYLLLQKMKVGFAARVNKAVLEDEEVLFLWEMLCAGVYNDLMCCWNGQ